MPETQPEPASPVHSADPGPDILSRILQTKRTEVARLARQEGELRARVEDAPDPRDFRAALSRPGVVSLIAEIKRRSPGAGPIRPNLDPGGLAADYRAAGASALSVLTDQDYFGGSLTDLSEARASTEIPVLRKDFVISDLQILEARASGADAILLIVRVLEDRLLRDLREAAERVGMTALVEVHDRVELERAVGSGASVIGINNRNLRDFTTRLETTTELVGSVPDSAVLVSESGIRDRSDVASLGRVGVDAILVGEALLRAANPADKARELSGVPASRRSSSPAQG